MKKPKPAGKIVRKTKSSTIPTLFFSHSLEYEADRII